MEGKNTIKVHKCVKCGAVLTHGGTRCPECNSRRVVSYEMENPMARLPMAALLNVAGHCIWILGVAACIALLWDTNSDDESRNWLMALAGFGALFVSLVLSVAMFGLGEILSRVIRVQRRVRAFTKEYYAQDLAVCETPEAPGGDDLRPAESGGEAAGGEPSGDAPGQDAPDKEDQASS